MQTKNEKHLETLIIKILQKYQKILTQYTRTEHSNRTKSLYNNIIIRMISLENVLMYCVKIKHSQKNKKQNNKKNKTAKTKIQKNTKITLVQKYTFGH